jgi:hypothetical protein
MAIRLSKQIAVLKKQEYAHRSTEAKRARSEEVDILRANLPSKAEAALKMRIERGHSSSLESISAF